ncbi:MAG TPA: MBL fold metallo-hydrolase [Pseudolabrys sp.]|nr:MBL fold metallo-hydrolase [Pseudolabrys sp.]
MSDPQLKHIGKGVHAWIGAGGDSNAGAIETPLGLIVIDAQQNRALGEKFRNALTKTFALPVRAVINTHFHLDHVAGNIAFADVPIVAHQKTLQALERELGPLSPAGASVTDTLTKIRMFFGSNFEELVPKGERGWFTERVGGSAPLMILPPTEAFADQLEFRLPEDSVHVDYWGPAHCDGDVVIHLKKTGVVFMGDLFFHGRFPWFGDCDLSGWIAALDRVLKIDVATVVPGHGQPASLKELAGFQMLLSAVREEVDKAVKAGWSEDAAARDITLADYAAMQRYREWMPYNIRAVYRYLRGG